MQPFYLQYEDEQIEVTGHFPGLGEPLPSFMLVDDHNNDVPLESFQGRPKALLTLLSLDENEHGGLALLQDTRRRLEKAPAVELIVVTVDSPSSLRRARREHGLPGVALLSTLRGRDFHKHYGVLLSAYPLAGYTAPALILADVQGRVVFAERLLRSDARFDSAALGAALAALAG